ncbi:hypothetical protein [Liquorilactobacillus sucicola]|nr:hypothetical protein [Liquorilactobacillus sucicola]
MATPMLNFPNIEKLEVKEDAPIQGNLGGKQRPARQEWEHLT